MIELNEDDFRPLEEFPLAWRWNDARRRILPVDVFSNIRPLTPDKAKEIYNQFGQRSQRYEGFLPSSFRLVNKINTSIIDAGVVRHWLEAHIQDQEQVVVLSWGATSAVATTANIFCHFWDDFCYPASDDVTILPLSEVWILVYFHEEVFSFGEHIET